MKPLHQLDKYDSKILTSIIENEIEESLNIEFKQSEALSKKPAVKKEISKDIASFANSDGGIIIYGIKEENHKASSFTFINGEEFTKESLEHIINSTIKREIKNLKIFPVRFNNKIENTVYIVQIPSSIDAPHMSQDKRFYKRNNFESTMMEEYEVRSLYGRKIKGSLKIDNLSVTVFPENADEDETQFKINLLIENDGDKLIKDYRANVYYSGELSNCNLVWSENGQGKNYSHTILEDKILVTNERVTTLFPSEKLNVLDFSFNVKNEYLEKFLNSFELSAKLFFENECLEEKFKSRDLMLEAYLNRDGEFSLIK